MKKLKSYSEFQYIKDYQLAWIKSLKTNCEKFKGKEFRSCLYESYRDQTYLLYKLNEVKQ